MPHLERKVCWQGDTESNSEFQNKRRKAKGGNHLRSSANDQPCVGEHVSRQGQRVYPDL